MIRALAARPTRLRDELVRLRRKSDAFDHLFDLATADRGEVAQVLRHGEILVHGRRLGHVAEVAANGGAPGLLPKHCE